MVPRFVDEDMLRVKILAKFLSDGDVELDLTQAGRVLLPFEQVDVGLPVEVLKRAARECGEVDLTQPCAMQPCCWRHRHWLRFRRECQHAARPRSATMALRARVRAFWDAYVARYEHRSRSIRPHRGKFLEVVALGRRVTLGRDEVRALEGLPFMDLWEGLLVLWRGFNFINWLQPATRAARGHAEVSFGCVVSAVGPVLARCLGRRVSVQALACCSGDARVSIAASPREVACGLTQMCESCIVSFEQLVLVRPVVLALAACLGRSHFGEPTVGLGSCGRALAALCLGRLPRCRPHVGLVCRHVGVTASLGVGYNLSGEMVGLLPPMMGFFLDDGDAGLQRSLAYGEDSCSDCSGSSARESCGSARQWFHYSNKCLQDVVLSFIGAGGLRLRARAYFEAVCANDARAGVFGCSMERLNFEAVLAFLVASGSYLWILDDSSASFVGVFGCSFGWRLGAEQGTCLGCAQWSSLSGHVRARQLAGNPVELPLWSAP